MHAFLVTGGTKETRLSHMNQLLNDESVSPFDRTFLKREDGTAGVADVRDFTKKLSLAPFGGKILAGIIEDAHALTPEAQNALLKTLEEPSSKTKLFLETANADVLLATITSRCQIISLGTAEQYTVDDLLLCFKTLEQLGQATIGERMKMIDAVAIDRDTAKTWVEKAICASRAALLQEYSSVIPAKSLSSIQSGTGIHQDGSVPAQAGIELGMTTQLIRRLLSAQHQLSANVTPKLVLDAIFLDFMPQ